MKLGRPWTETHPTTWHRWFAWRPVLTDKTRLVWLEHVDRRFDNFSDDVALWCWEYREIDENSR